MAITLLIAPLYALIVWIVQPVIEERRQARNIMEQANISLDRYRQILAEHASRQPMANVSAAESNAGSGFIAADNETLAAVELQNRLRALVESSNGELRSMQMLAMRTEGRMRRISLRVQVSLDFGGLRNLIYTTESSDPYILIDGMELRIRGARTPTQANQLPAGEGSRLLDMRLDVSAYMRPRAS
ncbi:MAG TPA: type II secretion system protein GspM [Alphaproteobacteria bacterium]|nr:type II secretion system protein GspM [Alphaproteobacteria bacterium]